MGLQIRLWINHRIQTYFLHYLKKRRGLLKYQAFFQELFLLLLQALNFNNHDMESNGELAALRYIARHIPADALLLDVGGNIGDYSSMLLSIFGKQATIHTFEPSSQTYPLLVQRFKAVDQVHLHQIGLSDEIGTTNLYYAADLAYSGNSSVFQRDLSVINQVQDQVEVIQLDTLAHFCTVHQFQHIHLLKLDIEGGEYRALKGGANLLSQQAIDYIQFEVGGANIEARVFFKDLYELLSPNYMIYRIVKNGLLRLDRYQGEFELFSLANYVAIARNIAPTTSTIATQI